MRGPRPPRARPAPRMNPPRPDSTGSPMSTQTGRTTAVVLAAGLGTRMKSSVAKVLHPLCGRPMLAFVLDAWDEAAGPEATSRPIVVYSPSVEAIKDPFTDRAEFALQDEP